MRALSACKMWKKLRALTLQFTHTSHKHTSNQYGRAHTALGPISVREAVGVMIRGN